MAQGKIGSGFDIATSVFGSLLFRRSMLKMDALNTLSTVLSNECEQRIVKEIMDKMAMSELKNICIPPYFCLIMAIPNNCFGSKTPKMVKKVLDWKENNGKECDALWNRLNESNECVIEIFE